MTQKTIHVLNAQGKDIFQRFETKQDVAEPANHPPINFHAYPAATKGCFAQHTEQILNKDGIVIVLVRRRIGRALKAIKKLRSAGFTVWITFKETGAHQIASAMTSTGNRATLEKCIELADAIVIPSPAARQFFRSIDTKNTLLIDLPTPYPIDHAAWSNKLPGKELGEGIMIGTREFKVPSRNHASAIRIAARVAAENQCRLTIINPKAKKFHEQIAEAVGDLPKKQLHVIDTTLPYREYLKLITSHRVVFQLDTSGVPGQVAGDCLLANTLCVGGNGEVESIAFADYAITHDDIDSRNWGKILTEFITNDDVYTVSLKKSRAIATSTLSFSAFRHRLKSLDLSCKITRT